MQMFRRAGRLYALLVSGAGLDTVRTVSEDEPESPKKSRYRLLEDKEFNAKFEAELEQALDEAFGPARRRPPPPSHWPELSTLIRDAALMHKLEPEAYELEKIGRFEGLATIGAGGFGTVFKVRDPDLDRVVALKLCRAGRSGAEKALLEEAKILGKIKHPNIITAHEVGRYGEAIFLVTEYVHALNMFEYAVEDPLRWEVVVDLFISVGETLADAHDAGLVHGDLKPENMLVELDTKATYLVDFGLARIMSPTPEQLGSERGGIGTLYYMAPELLLGGVGDRLSDQYAFAVSLWQSLEGRVPYIGDSEGMLEAIEYGEPMRWRPDVPARVYEVISKGFSERPDDRYPDMRTFVHELGLARGPRPAPQPLDTNEEVAISPSEGVERPRLAGKKGIVFGLALMITGAGVLGEFYLHSQPQRELPPKRTQQTPLMNARAGFHAAYRALDDEDFRGCYEQWMVARRILRKHDPLLGGVLSLSLAELLAEADPGRKASAWVAVGAAEMFEEAPAWSRQTTLHERAAHARERAAELYEAADALELATEQRSCSDANRRGEVCAPSPEGISQSSQPTPPLGSE